MRRQSGSPFTSSRRTAPGTSGGAGELGRGGRGGGRGAGERSPAGVDGRLQPRLPGADITAGYPPLRWESPARLPAAGDRGRPFSISPRLWLDSLPLPSVRGREPRGPCCAAHSPLSGSGTPGWERPEEGCSATSCSQPGQLRGRTGLLGA